MFRNADQCRRDRSSDAMNVNRPSPHRFIGRQKRIDKCAELCIKLRNRRVCSESFVSLLSDPPHERYPVAVPLDRLE
jgi:hypothetical protein